MKKPRKLKTIPGATMRGTYTTYENSTARDYLKRLGHVVDFRIENLVNVELANWGSGLKVFVDKGAKVTVQQDPDGRTRIFIAK